MPFKFNFSTPSDDTIDDEAHGEHADNFVSDDDDTKALPSQEISRNPEQNVSDMSTIEHNICGAVFRVIRQQDVNDSSSALQVTADSDLVPGVYEGGLKIWECGVDLAEFLINHNIDCKGLRVLELGCGAGLPGLTAMHKEAAEVHFQDYNPEVVENITIPNVALNQCSHCKCRFFSGDWSSLPSTICTEDEAKRYDMILTAETIYNTRNYSKLHQAFQHLLKQSGTIYLAAKSTYFGVGGGTRLFETFLKRGNVFTSQVCLEIQAGVPREILKVTRQTS
ncbi:histidine protein methyltransferase 1 homolog [Haliotis rufescens]|uniref:histidine protein methyltransferase 1 homolog n=1 Tax=Haliotis rufescens TaxID=6454 RepID=UPI001EAFAEFC|nr:histidine protein methyltransferase 1 homolog [Haliotis rufescens]